MVHRGDAEDAEDAEPSMNRMVGSAVRTAGTFSIGFNPIVAGCL